MNSTHFQLQNTVLLNILEYERLQAFLAASEMKCSYLLIYFF